MSPPTRRGLRKLALFTGIAAALYLLVRATGVLDDVAVEDIRGAVERAGVWGFVVFVLLFTVGELVQVPGTLFVVAAVLAFGTPIGIGLSFVAAMTSVSVSFFFARQISGKALEDIESGWMKRMLSTLHDRPVRTVALLRAVFWYAPPLNYALAFAGVRFRDYFVGSLAGLAAPTVGIALFAGHFLG
jgi:uncharacterized membrane protein YdjX (TVP38/TMEM64 family)